VRRVKHLLRRVHGYADARLFVGMKDRKRRMEYASHGHGEGIELFSLLLNGGAVALK